MQRPHSCIKILLTTMMAAKPPLHFSPDLACRDTKLSWQSFDIALTVIYLNIHHIRVWSLFGVVFLTIWQCKSSINAFYFFFGQHCLLHLFCQLHVESKPIDVWMMFSDIFSSVGSVIFFYRVLSKGRTLHASAGFGHWRWGFASWIPCG